VELYGPEMETLIVQVMREGLQTEGPDGLKWGEKVALIRAWLDGYSPRETSHGAGENARGRNRLAQAMEGLTTARTAPTPSRQKSETPTPPDAGSA